MTREQTERAAGIMLAWVRGSLVNVRTHPDDEWGPLCASPMWDWSRCDYELEFPQPSPGPEPEPSEAPPVGLRPRWIAEEHRLTEIEDAICRYVEAGKDIPSAWAEELMHLLGRLRDHGRQDGPGDGGSIEAHAPRDDRHEALPALEASKGWVYAQDDRAVSSRGRQGNGHPAAPGEAGAWS